MTGGSQAVGTDVGYTGSFTPQMSAPINFSVQGGGAVGAGKTVRGSRLGRGGPELTRPVSGNVTMGNVSISSTMSPTFSNIGNVDASVKGVSGGTQAQVSPISMGVGEVPRMAGEITSTQTVGRGQGTGGESVGPRPKGFDLSSYDVTSQGGKGFGLKDIEYLRSQGVTDTQLKDFAGGLGANVNIGNVARQQLGMELKTPPQQAPYAPGVTPPAQTTKQPTASQPANQAVVSLLAPTGGSTPTSFQAPGTQTQGPLAPGSSTTTTTTSTKPSTTTKTKAKAETAKAKAQQVVKAKQAVKTAKETPKEDRTKADQKALEAAKAKLQLERLQAEKEKAERTKQEQKAVAEAKAKAQAAAEAAAKAKAKAQAAKKSEPAKTTKKK